MAQLGQALRLDLPHPLAGHAERAADLFEGPRLAVGEPVAHPHDLALALTEMA